LDASTNDHRCSKPLRFGWSPPRRSQGTRPRPYEAIGFHELRNIAAAYDPLRLIIERRKDQICRLPWTIRAKHEGAGKRPNSAQRSSQMRCIIREAVRFFKCPTDETSFRTWLRMLLEDLLVLDAPSIYCERDHAGNLIALSPTDGATIERVIDEKGRLPRAFRW
jgi:hypothetical protein